jgi:hypothetical protein
MPDDNLYDDAPAAQPPSRAPAPPGAAADEKDDEAGTEATALLPKDFFPSEGVEVGDRCTVEVTAVHDEEVSVKYQGAAEKPDEKEEPSGPPAAARVPAMAGGDDMFE